MKPVLLIDVDGTLLNSFDAIVGALRCAFNELDLAWPSQDILDKLPGPPLEVTMAKCGLNEEMITTAVNTYRKYYSDTYWRQSAVFPGWAEGLTRWKEAGYTLCTATSKGEAITTRILEHLNLTQYFDFIGGADEQCGRRTKAEVIAWVLEHLDLAPNQPVLMIGDRCHDVEGAAHFGIPTALVTWGHGSQEEWDAADYVAHDFGELEVIVNQIATSQTR